jgi:hypothetical protein
MNHSNQINELAAALVSFQQEVPQVKKGNTAEVVSKRTGGKFQYKYADLADVYNAAMPVSTKNGIAIIQGFTGGCLQTRLVHSSGQWMEDEGLKLPVDLPPQELGSAITYFRRYGALSALGIAPEEDDDAGSATVAHRSKPQVSPVSRFNQQAAASLAEDDLSFLNDDRHPAEETQEVQPIRQVKPSPHSVGSVKAISEKQAKRLWAIAKQQNMSSDAVLGIVGASGYESVETIGWKDYEKIVAQIEGAA